MKPDTPFKFNPQSNSTTQIDTPIVDSLILNQMVVDPNIHWQIHNCKITQMDVDQEHPLPFLYHYDTLSDELKAAHPLTTQLLSQFNTPMSATEACELLGVSQDTIDTPWQVKVVGTLVLYSELRQLALRVSFTNSAKTRDPIYTQAKDDAIKAAMQQWHLFGDVFVLYKHQHPMLVLSNYNIDDDADTVKELNESYENSNYIGNDTKINGNLRNITTTKSVDTPQISMHAHPPIDITQHLEYQKLPCIYAQSILTELTTHHALMTQLDEAIQARVL